MAAVPPQFGDMFKDAADVHQSAAFASLPLLKLKLLRSADLAVDDIRVVQETEQRGAGAAPRTKISIKVPVSALGGSVSAYVHHPEQGGSPACGAEAVVAPGAGVEVKAKADRSAGGDLGVSGQASKKDVLPGLGVTVKGDGRKGTAELLVEYLSPYGVRVCPSATVAGGKADLRAAVTCAAAAAGGTAIAGVDARAGGTGAAAAALQAAWRSAGGGVLCGVRADLREGGRPVTAHALAHLSRRLRVALTTQLAPGAEPAAAAEGDPPPRPLPQLAAGAAYDAEWAAAALRADAVSLTARCATRRGAAKAEPAGGVYGEVAGEARWRGGTKVRAAARAPVHGAAAGAATFHAAVELGD